MPDLKADAQPEKRLFISLLTRDISLVAAFLDLIDNSINAAMLPYADRLKDAEGYRALAAEAVTPKVKIKIEVGRELIKITDNAGGISKKSAEEEVFKFGRAETYEVGDEDRLSVYGIGLKRAIFKMGDQIDVTSDHSSGGFSMSLNVPKWQATKQVKWEIPITARKAAAVAACGTVIEITKLRPDVVKRVSDSTFEDDLKETISKTYAYFLGRFVEIEVNGEAVKGVVVDFDGNVSSDVGTFDGVSFTISAGLARPGPNGQFVAENSGWFVFCNGRNVIYGDKGGLTGWGVDGFLPQFQPKHRPFLGLVFFVAEDPEALPWTTTKAAINQESSVWQEAKRRMAVVGRGVITYLDRRYTDEGVDRSLAEIAASQTARVSMLDVATLSQRREFAAPVRKPVTDVSIQYRAKLTDVNRIRTYRGNSNLSAREVGRYTFDYFLENVIED